MLRRPRSGAVAWALAASAAITHAKFDTVATTQVSAAITVAMKA